MTGGVLLGNWYLANLSTVHFTFSNGIVTPFIESVNPVYRNQIIFDGGLGISSSGAFVAQSVVWEGSASAPEYRAELLIVNPTLKDDAEKSVEIAELPDGINAGGLNLNKIFLGLKANRPVLLAPMSIRGYRRGSLSAPGAIAPNPGGDYGQETVMMENANSEVDPSRKDYETNRANGAVDPVNDHDLVRVDLSWPKGLKIDRAKLSLVAVGMEVDGSKPLSAATVKEVGPSLVQFYDANGQALDEGDFVIDDLGNPDDSYLSKILDTGTLTLFIEGGALFGQAGSIAEGYSRLGGAVLKFEFTQNNVTSRQRLLVYRGGFLDFKVPTRPGFPGTLYFFDGKGRVDNKVGRPLKGNEFSLDVTDYGNELRHWEVKSGKTGGLDYDLSDKNGHTPLGWWWQKAKPVPERDLDHYIQGIEKQGAMCRWRQDDETDPRQRFINAWEYDPVRDKGKAKPDSIHFEYLMSNILPSTYQHRSGIAIHPDGKKDGTQGCIGIQSWQGCNEVNKILSSYSSLKVKVEPE